jgi:hypothetical protein
MCCEREEDVAAGADRAQRARCGYRLAEALEEAETAFRKERASPYRRDGACCIWTWELSLPDRGGGTVED